MPGVNMFSILRVDFLYLMMGALVGVGFTVQCLHCKWSLRLYLAIYFDKPQPT